MRKARNKSRMDHAGDDEMKRPPRFAIARSPDAGAAASIEGGELHHMRDVMRLKAGDTVAMIDPTGREHLGAIVRYEPSRAVIRLTESRATRSDFRIILAAAIIKGPRMDFLVEKAAELGAAELWPIQCTRGLVRSSGGQRIARWRRLALAAAKQSLAAHPMDVREPVSFADLIRGLPGDTLALMCTIGAEPLGAVIGRLSPRAILMACGPEGDFDDEERAAAAKAGFIAAGLGPNRLRAETAAMAAVGIAASAMAEWQS
jgi:16S rRNA (uracil1498-N3)-methyltransferase